MLKIIKDNRSGDNLEIVVPIYNENKLILEFIKYYKKYDLVFLDGGSSDGTLEIINQNEVTVYSRDGQNQFEEYFQYYINHATVSKRCFIMLIDEYITIENLDIVNEYLRGNNKGVNIRRLEWYYGELMPQRKIGAKGKPRGLKKGDASFVNSLHDGLKYTNIKHKNDLLILDINHLHIRDTAREFGKQGEYLNTEIYQLMDHSFFKKWCRRFLIPLILYLLWWIWDYKVSFKVRVFRLLELLVSLFLSLMILYEIKIQMNSDLQSKKYKNIYKKII